MQKLSSELRAGLERQEAVAAEALELFRRRFSVAELPERGKREKAGGRAIIVRFSRRVVSALSVPVPAYALAAAVVLMLVVPVVVWHQLSPAGVGVVKEVTSGVSAVELFEALYGVDETDPAEIEATIKLLEEYLQRHEDLAVHVKLAELYEALARLGGGPTIRAPSARRRASEEARIAREGVRGGVVGDRGE